MVYTRAPADPLCYTQLQKATRKFICKAVYNFDMQFYMSLADKPSLQFDQVDSTLYTTILDSSAVRKESILCQRCKSEFHLGRDRSFRAKTTKKKIRAQRKWTRERRPISGSSTNGSTIIQKVAISSSDEPANKARNANEPTHARLVGGTTPLPIARSLPKLDSPSTWTPGNTPCMIAMIQLSRTNYSLVSLTEYTLVSEEFDNHAFQTITSPLFQILNLSLGNLNGRSVLIVRSAPSSNLHSSILSDRQWALYLKSAQHLLNGESSTSWHGPPVTRLRMESLRMTPWTTLLLI